MLSEKIRKQDFAVKILKTHESKERLAHAYLLTGEKSAGKEDLAMAFAKALNCESGHLYEDCACGSCHKIETGQHPDVKWAGMEEKTRSIKIEEMRDWVGQASLKPYEGKYKVFILANADKLTADASNAILKTLEEPPPRTVFILTTESRFAVLETILSRCFEIRLKPGTTEAAENAVTDLSRQMGGRPWTDFLDDFSGKPREDVKRSLDGLMEVFRRQMQKTPVAEFLKGIDLLLETKEALEANANQKLALSRLAMRLGKILAPGKFTP